MTIQEFFRDNPRAALAFSGGTDSSYLLYAASRSGCDLRPYFLKTAFQLAFELEDAKKLCAALGVALTILELDVLAREEIVRNPADRCYYCKKALFTALTARARADGYPLVIDGTNASDDADDRPGMRALRELGVRSPLRECGITKKMVRAESAQAGLFTAAKPSYACLATRIPAGERIEAETLRRVETAESFLSSLGFSDLALVKARLGSLAGLVMDEEAYHDTGARLSFRVPAEKAEETGRLIVDLTSGRAEIGT